MKKTLSIIALVLAITVSLIAGTMSYYYTEINDLAEGSVVAKEFILLEEGEDSFKKDVKIAPGEEIEWTFAVKNYDGPKISETAMDLVFTINLAATDGKSGRDICDDWAERLPGSPILKGQPDAGNAAELAMLAKLEQYGIDAHGVYLPGRTPVDHPNGLCIVQSVLVPREEILRRYGF